MQQYLAGEDVSGIEGKKGAFFCLSALKKTLMIY